MGVHKEVTIICSGTANVCVFRDDIAVLYACKLLLLRRLQMVNRRTHGADAYTRKSTHVVVDARRRRMHVETAVSGSVRAAPNIRRAQNLGKIRETSSVEAGACWRAHTHTHTHGDNSSLHAVGRSEARANVKTESKRFKLDPLFSYFKEHIWRIGIQDISSTINVQLSALIFYFSITLFVCHPMV